MGRSPPTPTLDGLWRQAHPDLPEGRNSLHPERGSLRIPSPSATRECDPAQDGGRVGGVGGGVAALQPRCRGAQPRCCGNRFQANRWLLAPRSGSLAHWRPPSPFLPLVWAGGGAGRGGGPGRRPGAREWSGPAGRGRPLDRLPPALRPRPLAAAAAVLTGPGILLELVLLAPGERRGPRRQNPGAGVECGGPGELTGSKSSSERWAGAAGRAHGRVHGASRAQRARARPLAQGPRPPPLTAEEAIPGAKGAGPAPICSAGLALHRECARQAAHLLATGCPGRAHAGGPGTHNRRSTRDAQSSN